MTSLQSTYPNYLNSNHLEGSKNSIPMSSRQYSTLSMAEERIINQRNLLLLLYEDLLKYKPDLQYKDFHAFAMHFTT